MFKPGEIVIAAFPFTSLTSVKRRPCVVLAAGDTPGDFIVAFVTSANVASGLRSAVAIGPTHPEWKKTGLKTMSIIRADKLETLNDSVISGAIGILPPDILEAVRNKLKALLQTT
ncbi:MAG: type II toxin-antitoxin system PemK/MazF family toxin [Pedosphaera sp.]|nr:type II toxin-antitoxin system PemK/MazF family toxin [Pedosphaera sp.]